MTRGKILKCAWMAVFVCGMLNMARGNVPVHEEGGTKLMTDTQAVEQYSDKNETADEQRMKMDTKRNEYEGKVDETAQKMGALEEFLTALQKLLDGQQSSLDFKDQGAWEGGVKASLKMVQLDSQYDVASAKIHAEGHPGGDPNNPSSDQPSDGGDYSSVDGKLLVEKIITEAPRWMDTTDSGGPPKGPPPNGAFYSPRTKNLLVKVAAQVRAKLERKMRSSRIEFLAYGMAKDLLPDKMVSSFNASKVVSYLLGKAGVVELGEGVFMRPSAAQDVAFGKYANLDSDETGTTLFWSDPMVLDGYHPLFGTSLNQTALKGYRGVDMDNTISRGYSRRIERYNLMQSPEKRITNPFKGYAARVVPGLIYMAQSGRLKDGEIPDDRQLAEAMKLTKKLSMLPSQNMKIKVKKASFCFSYPPRIILVQGAPPGGMTGMVELPELDRKVFERSMFIAGKRLREINTLKDEIRKGRHYANDLIQSLQKLAQQLEEVSQNMSQDVLASIPQITQMRKQVFDSMEHDRWIMSKLEYEYDDLLHREWTILHHILDSRNGAIIKLMDDAPIRYRTAKAADQIEQTEESP